MTTTRPTADGADLPLTDASDLSGPASGGPAGGALPAWLPDEATLNRLAGEFFAALPGDLPGPAAPRSSTSRTSGGVEDAARVDVPARSSDIPAVPGDAGGSGTRTPVPPPVAPGLPGGPAGDPAAAGVGPGRAVPDLGEAMSAVLGAAGLGVPGPEGSVVPGLTGLQLADPGALTPAAPGVVASVPHAGGPGHDPAGGGTPGSLPDATGPVAGRPDRPAGGVPFEVPALHVPLPGGEQVPPLPGLAAPFPGAGMPGVTAGDPTSLGGGLPGGPPDVGAAAPPAGDRKSVV